jgi:quercetin dioxygenase-like cupin family protein
MVRTDATVVRLGEGIVRTTGIKTAATAAAIFAITTLLIAGSTVAQDKTSRARTAFTGKLPELDGRNLTATVVEVTYLPGGANPAHRHPCPVIGYVLAGAVRMQLKDHDAQVFRVGDTFFESPSDVHAVSANASPDEPARFLAYFVCDRATPLTLPVSLGQDAQ